MMDSPDKAQGNMIRNLLLDIILPVLILNKLSPYLGEHGAVKALILAMSLPLAHGLYGLIKEKKINWVSFLGLINVALTGGFALMKLEGFWFAVKEASFPAVIGLFVLGSAFTRKPLFAFFLNQPALFKIDLIQEKLQENGTELAYKGLVKKCTVFFSVTFFLSALLNFVLAVSIFVAIDETLNEAQKADILNEQIAKMTWMGYIVIAIPLMVITGSIFYYCLNRMGKLTKMPLTELMKS